MTTQHLYPQTIIAIIWDFDGTLIPGYMQKPLFDEYGIDSKIFWSEVNNLPALYADQGVSISKDTAYLNHILTYTQHGTFKDLTNNKLRDFGARLDYYPGIPDFLNNVKQFVKEHPEYSKHGIEVEHYIVSTGLRQIIEGSAVRPFVDGVWACEYIENVVPPGPQPKLDLKEVSTISQIGSMLDNTTKTRAIFEISKGTNHDPRIDVNASIPLDQRRVPFPHMIYIADGPSDIPCFSLIKHFLGKTYAVYDRTIKKSFSQAVSLNEQGRVQSYGEADYTEGSQTYMWIIHTVETIANQILVDRSNALKKHVKPPPNHIITSSRNGRPEDSSNRKL